MGSKPSTALAATVVAVALASFPAGAAAVKDYSQNSVNGEAAAPLPAELLKDYSMNAATGDYAPPIHHARPTRVGRPGDVLTPDYEGVRSGSFSNRERLLMVQVALPEGPPEDALGYLRSATLDALDEAERWAMARAVPNDLRRCVRSFSPPSPAAAFGAIGALRALPDAAAALSSDRVLARISRPRRGLGSQASPAAVDPG